MYKVYVEIYNDGDLFADDYFDDIQSAVAWAIDYTTELCPSLYSIHTCTYKITNDQQYIEQRLTR